MLQNAVHILQVTSSIVNCRKKEHFKSCAQILCAMEQFLLKAPISMIDSSPCKMNTKNGCSLILCSINKTWCSAPFG